jgi:hypothetical protein
LIQRFLQSDLNEVALPSAAATDASRVVTSGQCLLPPVRDHNQISKSCIPRKCLISK